MAPEMKNKQPYHHSVDWYSLGKLILDFQVARLPTHACTHGRTHTRARARTDPDAPPSTCIQGRNPYSEESRFWESSGLLDLLDGLLIKDPDKRLGCGHDGVRGIQRMKFFREVDWALLDAKKAPSPLRREWYVREPDVTLSRQFRNGEDINKVVEKLQHMSLDGTGDSARYLAEREGETGPGEIPNWDYVHPRAVYQEYLQSPYHNAKTFQ